VGEAAGALAAFAIHNNVLPKDVPADTALLRVFQRELLSAGVPLFWWTDVVFGDAAYEAAHLCGVAGIMSGTGSDMNFQPQDDFGFSARAAVDAKLGRTLNWPLEEMTRAQAAAWILSQLGS